MVYKCTKNYLTWSSLLSSTTAYIEVLESENLIKIKLNNYYAVNRKK